MRSCSGYPGISAAGDAKQVGRIFLKKSALRPLQTERKGTTVLEVGNAFVKKGYRIKIFNTINFKKSMHYNPFHYIHSEKDILKLVTTLMTNT